MIQEQTPLDYQTFLQTKQVRVYPVGMEIALTDLHPRLFPFQRAVVQWALRKGRAAIFADCGLGKCVVAGTMIPTEDGLKSIEQLQPPNSDLGLTPLQVKVQTPEGPADTSHFYSSGHNPTLRVTTHMGYQVAGTHIHPLLILDRDGMVKWRQLQDIQVGDYIAVQRHSGLFGRTIQLPPFDYVRKGDYGATEKAIAVSAFRANNSVLTRDVLRDIRTKLGRNVSFDMVRKWAQQDTDYTPGNVTTPILPMHLTESLAYILGVLVGDGSLRHPVNVLLTSADEEIIVQVREWAASLNLALIQTGHLSYEIRSVVLKRWLLTLGLSDELAHAKVVPHTILAAPKECVRSFLQGLFDTDGSALKCGGVEFCSASESLARHVHLLLLQFGIVARLRFKANTKRGAWIIQMFGTQARKFYELIGFRLTRKQERMAFLPVKNNTNLDVIPHLPDVKWHDRRRGFRNYQVGCDCPSYTKLRKMAEAYPELSILLEPEYFWDRVEEVADNGIVPTYDLTVPGPHAFVANGIVSHNTFMQLEWANVIHRQSGGDVLILAPLAVARQTVAEGVKLGIEVQACRSQADVRPGLNITNYEMLSHFDVAHFSGVVLDESSILKSYMGKTKRALVEAFARTPYRLCCTATPAPNDVMEIGNHSEFLGVMPSNEMLMRFFINDTMSNGHYRLKGHAEKDFWQWVSSWAISLRRPSDLGYSDDGFSLPELQITRQYVETDVTVGVEDGQLFRAPAMSATNLHKEMRITAADRAQAVADLVNPSDDTWVVWCNTNYEADELVKRIPDALEVRGAESVAVKEKKLTDFAEGRARVIISKPEIAGYGLNWQHCHRTAFVGLSYSFENFYQAVRRLYRFGQQHPVEVVIVAAETESPLVVSLERKIRAHMQMSDAMNTNASQLALQEELHLMRHEDFTVEQGRDWQLYHGDCVTVARSLPAESMHFSIFSPPFSGLYIYSDAIEDMGNAATDDEFFRHLDFLIPELLRLTKPGRLCAVHCKDLVNYKGRDGAAGLRDFSGEVIKRFSAAGWVYHSKVTIWKDPVIEMQRTKAHGLLYKQLRADSTFSRQGLPEYLLMFRKWPQGEHEEAHIEPVTHTHEDFPLEIWQRYASPVWFDIRQTRVLNVEQARESQDEKHICPLQLDVIERAVQLWSNPGDVVFSPFAGIGSEGFETLRLGRKFVGVELKESYFQVARKNLERMVREKTQATLFDGVLDEGEVRA